MTRLATIGCGEHATGTHGPSLALYAERHPGTELVACCDLDPGKAERYRARFGFARAYTDLRRMLDTERPDAVSLVAPVERTCELACLIFEWGFPLLVEKPPGRTVAEVDRMIAAAGGVAHQVAFNRRFAPLLRELKRDVKGDEWTDSRLPFVQGGFFGEYVAFLDALREGRAPSPSLKEARQSVAVAECIRERKGEYRA